VLAAITAPIASIDVADYGLCPLRKVSRRLIAQTPDRESHGTPGTHASQAAAPGVHKGEFAGIQPTGKKVSGDLMLFYRITDGLIAEHWMQWDMKAVMDQLTH
jgi:hypothetical protein